MKSSDIRSQSAKRKNSQTKPRVGQVVIGLDPATSALCKDLRQAIQQKNYEKAVSITFRKGCCDRDVINARGVCYLRMGNVEEAVKVFRSLTLQPGCTWIRQDCPQPFLINFATALLLSGHPHGCLGVLGELDDELPPPAQRLQEAIKRWESTLSWWNWLNWRFLCVEPSMNTFQLTFEPGVLSGAIATDPLEANGTRIA